MNNRALDLRILIHFRGGTVIKWDSDDDRNPIGYWEAEFKYATKHFLGRLIEYKAETERCVWFYLAID